MRKARILLYGKPAGILIEQDPQRLYVFEYSEEYQGPPVSLTMPLSQRRYEFKTFPAFFDGFLPEGPQLEALLRYAKLDRNDGFGQLIVVGADLVGAVTVEILNE